MTVPPPSLARAAPPAMAPPRPEMAPPVPAPSPAPDPRPQSPALGTGVPNGDADAWLRQMRLLRAEAQDLRVVLDDVRKGGAPLSLYADYLRRSCADMDALVRRVDNDDDTVRHVQNAWEQMRTCSILREPEVALDPQLQMQLLNLLDTQARRIIYWTSYRTIPRRLEEWLQQTQPGYAIPFHAVFEDELPDQEDRQRIINYLACTPEALRAVGGLVDPEAGLVYRYDPSAQRRAWSVAKLVLAFAALTGVVVIAGSLLSPPPQPNWNTRNLLLGWVAVVVGAVTHAAVAMAKRLRTASAIPAVLPVGRLMILLNAKEGLILLRGAMALVGFLALAYTAAIPDPAHFGGFLLNALLVGYSLDSVIDLFGAGMDQRAAALQAGLKAKLGTGA